MEPGQGLNPRSDRGDVGSLLAEHNRTPCCWCSVCEQNGKDPYASGGRAALWRVGPTTPCCAPGRGQDTHLFPWLPAITLGHPDNSDGWGGGRDVLAFTPRVLCSLSIKVRSRRNLARLGVEIGLRMSFPGPAARGARTALGGRLFTRFSPPRTPCRFPVSRWPGLLLSPSSSSASLLVFLRLREGGACFFLPVGASPSGTQE